MELMITSETFSDYLDDQEYLDRLREGVDTSVRLIQDLQIELQDRGSASDEVFGRPEGAGDFPARPSDGNSRHS